MRARIDRIEAAIHRDVGRGVAPLFAASTGGLWGAVSALTASPPRAVGLLTGFFVPGGTPPAAETDGPAGAALLAAAFAKAGVPCRVLTDDSCRSACVAALRGAGVPAVPVDSVAPDADPDAAIATWRCHGIDWAIAIERCGPSADGIARNMRGEDVGRFTARLDRVFSAGPWRTIAIGDGGNEVGMGSLPPGLIARTVAFGAAIACVTPADYLITAGVSHWGAYALIAAMGWPECLDPAIDRRILETLVRDGPAVDGVTLGRTLTIDGIDLATHAVRMAALRRLAPGPPPRASQRQSPRALQPRDRP